MHKAFHKAYQFLSTRKSLFFGFVALLLGLLLYFGFKIQFNDDISKFVPKNDENQQLQEVLQNTKFDETVFINLRKSERASSDELTTVASSFIENLNGHMSQYVESIQGYVEDTTALSVLRFAYDNAPLLLHDSDYIQLNELTSSDSIKRITAENYRTLISPIGIISKDLIFRDPFKISLLALQNLNPTGADSDFKLKNNFLITKDEKNLLLFISPKADINNEDFAEAIYEIRDELVQNNTNIGIEIFGGKLIAAANAEQIKRDISITIGLALTVLLLLFILYYKTLLIPLILMIPTFFGGLMGLLALFILREDVSAISLGIGSVLLGVTLDYSLHILTHIRNGTGIKKLYKNIARPILISAVTTALAFLCLMFIDSQALQDLGVFASASVVSASIFALIFIPQAYRFKNDADRFSNSIIDKIASIPFHNNKILIIALLGLMLISTYTYNKVEFNQNLSDLNFIPTELQQAEKNLDNLTNTASKTLYITSFGNDLESIMQTNDEVAIRLDSLQNGNRIKSYNSLASFINSDSIQFEKIKKWDVFWKQKNVDSIRERFVAAGNQFNFKLNAFEPFYTYLKNDFKPITLEDIEQTGIINPTNFLSQGDDLKTLTTIVKVDEIQVDAIKNQFLNTENAIVIDRQGINESLLGNLKNDFNRLVIYCLIVVAVLLLLYYRNFKLTLITIVPILLTWLVTIGMMGLFGLQFNIFNIIMSSFIFGLGIDYSIFVTNGLLKSGKGNLKPYATNKASILLSVITTILGIGVLVFAKHPALQSIALVSIIGILAAMLISFTIQPLLFKFIVKNRLWPR